jgi:hypothetical protein
MKKPIVPSYVVALLLLLVLGGCEKKSGDAVVVGKDYVAAMKQGEEVKDERATNHDQWIATTAVRSKSVPVERSGRSCAKTVASK